MPTRLIAFFPAILEALRGIPYFLKRKGKQFKPILNSFENNCYQQQLKKEKKDFLKI